MAFERLQALEGYLEVIRHHNDFQTTLDTQCGQIATEISQMDRLDLQAATSLVGLLNQSTFWTAAHRQTLLNTIQQKVEETMRSTGVVRTRTAMQNYTNLPLYLTQADWETVLNSRNNIAVKLNVVMTRLWNLGLRCPSEPTSGMLTSVLLLSEPERLSDGLQMRASYTAVKTMVKNFLKERGSTPPAAVLKTLPATVAACPAALMQAAYTSQDRPEQLPMLPEGVSMEGLQQLENMVPNRSTNRQLQLHLPKAAGISLMGQCMGSSVWPPVLMAANPALQVPVQQHRALQGLLLRF